MDRNTPTFANTHSGHMDGYAPGTVINGMYRIVRMLGRGGIGRVYLANDLALDLPVALKFLANRFAHEPTVRARFDREARLLDSLRGLQVPRVLSTGTHERAPYIAMTVAPGRPLSQLIARRGLELPQERVVRIFSQLIDLLAQLEARGVMHRDIKADNILVRIDGPDAETVTLVDFGISLGSASQRLGAVTELGLVSGTPQYISPEQAQGAPLTAATDIYSLAMVCHEMLVGRLPFDGTDHHTLINQHLYIRPRSVRESGGQAPLWLDQLLTRMMEKVAERRPGAAEIQGILARVKAWEAAAVESISFDAADHQHAAA